VTEQCVYGAQSCMVCDASCKEAAGVASYCGDGAIDSTHGEQCDDHDAVTERCVYGSSSCIVCDAACKTTAGATSYCGDGVVDGANGEQCDDHNAQTERCPYGQTSCTVCDANCRYSPGATSYCGDGIVEAGNGEQCDDAGDMRCSSCKQACDTVFISYEVSGDFQLTDTSGGLGDGTWPQNGATLIVALPAGRSGPVPGAAGIVYVSAPLAFSQTIFFGGTTSIATHTLVSAGTASNRCPLNAGSLGDDGHLTWDVLGTGEWVGCPYRGLHGTSGWTPAQQQVASAHGPGCLEYASSGSITCNGPLCDAAGLLQGPNTVREQWDQPSPTAVFSDGFAKVEMRGLGTPAPGTGRPIDKVEMPDRTSGRSWIAFDGVETSRVCAWKPAHCPAPGAQ
jgi:hypothetical protein